MPKQSITAIGPPAHLTSCSGSSSRYGAWGTARMTASTPRMALARSFCTTVLATGTGDEHADVWDKVTVHYSGWTTDGKMFDSSIVRGTPATFGLNQVIPGWTEGLQLMVIGETRRIWIPENLAYAGRPGRPAGMLVFDVELLEIKN